MSTVNIFWFRRDLRLDDNVGFLEALKGEHPVLPIFIFDKEILNELPEDDARVTFIFETLQKMRDELQEKHGSSIALYHGKSETIWKQLLEDYKVDTVFTNHDYEPYALERDKKIKKLLEEVKDREFVGYSYDGADASFELLARRLLGEIPQYLTISKYDVSVKKESKNKINSFAKAHILVDGKEIVCEGSGNGPVNALDNAIRSNVDKVGKYSKYLKDLKLVDYKVRILNTGTNATTRVSIESTDSTGKSWFTIGVSPNIIEASFKALIDSLDYKLYKEKAPANL